MASTTVQPQAVPPPSRAVEAAREALQILLGADARLDIELPDGTSLYRSPSRPIGSLVLRDPRLLRAIALPPSDIAAGRAYIEGALDANGDVETIFAALEAALAERTARDWVRAGRAILRIPPPEKTEEPGGRTAAQLRGKRHSRSRDRAAIAYHYDLPPEFYALWLDHEMTYSCGYFRRPDDSLDTAQLNKYDHIARKLELRPGERVLDIGCGWGGFVRFCVREYGARAVGITLSERQAAYARDRIQREGLGEDCVVELRDYRDLGPLGTFDKVASIGMFEHVGGPRLRGYFQAAFDTLRPGGLFLNHGISWQMPRASGVRAVAERALDLRSSFMQRYVFPDGQLVHIDVALAAAEMAGFEVRDIENLREHYARTLRAWVKRLEANADQARQLASDAVVRTWRLYMGASARGFATGRMGLVQSLLAKRDAQGRAYVAPTRVAIYQLGT